MKRAQETPSVQGIDAKNANQDEKTGTSSQDINQEVANEEAMPDENENDKQC